MNGRRSSVQGGDFERAITDLEASLEPLFTAGRYRDFFTRVHALRQSLKTARFPPEMRDRLWRRLNQCAEAAKARQSREFAARNEQHLSRWRSQLETAERYAAALHAEIAELGARRGPRHELAIWQRRASEKRDRLADVQANAAELRRKIADITARSPLSF